MGEGSRASFCCSEGGGYVRGGRVPEDEEFDESAEEQDDGELAKEEALCEGESVGVSLASSADFGGAYEDSGLGSGGTFAVAILYGVFDLS